MNTLRFCLFLILAVNLSSCSTGSGSGPGVEKEDGFTFAFLTDIHVEYGKEADQGFQQAIDSVNALHPDFVITGGDLISDALGQTEEKATELYDLYLEMEKGFDMPVYNTVGNHEEFGFYEKSGISRDHPLYGDAMYEQRIGERFYVMEQKGWRFYILDAIEETPERRYRGFVDSVQINWLKADLEKVDTDQPIVIVTHIPFISAYAQFREGALAANPRGMVVENSKEVLDLFAGHNLRLVLQGHLHMLEEIYVGGIHFITGGAVSARWWDGPKDGMEEGFLVITTRGEDFDWEYVDYGWEVKH